MGVHRTGIAAALAAALLAGCSEEKASNGADTSSSTTATAASTTAAVPPTTQAPRTAKWTALQAGDCLADAPPTDPSVVTVTLVDCSTPHLA
jgi:hypothetical protein